jgi:hypothetical protein
VTRTATRTLTLYPRLVAGIVAAALALSAAFLASPARGQTGANER